MGETAKLHLDLQALIGSTIHDRYEVETLLGSGGMGAVFKARHTGLQRGVAIKVLHPEIGRDPSVSKRFDREAHSASRLDHPNCVRVTDFGTTENGTKYLVMELLEGGDLDGRLGRPWPPDRAVATIEQVLHGLEHAHHVGIVHRDLKPENIFVTTDFRGDEVIKIVDFGIAKLIDEQGAEKLTRQGVVFGTPRYMSPEQATGGKIDERTDLYAVGLMLYELLAGQPPFQTDDAAQLLRMHIMAPPPPLPAGVPEPLAKIVEKLLEKSKNDRFASAREVLDALAQLEGSLAAPSVAPVGSPASSGVAWQPAPDPAPVMRGGTLVAETGELAAVSMSAAARVLTRTGSHVGVGQPATGPFPSLATGSHPSLATGSHPSLSTTQPSIASMTAASLSGVELSASMANHSLAQPKPSSRRVLPITLAGVLLIVLVGVGGLIFVSHDRPSGASKQSDVADPSPPAAASQQTVADQPMPSESNPIVEDPSEPSLVEGPRRTSRPVRPAGTSDSKSEAPGVKSGDVDIDSKPEEQSGGSIDSSSSAADPGAELGEREATAEQQTPREPPQDRPNADRDKGRGNAKGQGKANNNKKHD